MYFASVFNPCVSPGVQLAIRRLHLPASRLRPISCRIDHNIAEWIFDVVIEFDIIGVALRDTSRYVLLDER
jgi:hypothetical protein